MKKIQVAACLLLVLGLPVRAQEPESLDVRVVTFNIWGLPWGLSTDRAARAARIGDALAELRPQLVALQEVWVPEDGARIAADLEEHGLPYSLHLSEGFLGSGLLVASAWPIRERRWQEFTLAGKAHKPWRGDWYARKGMLCVTVDTPLGSLHFATTHLHARYGSAEYLPTQITQALEGADRLGAEGLAPTQDPALPPLILGGDINSRSTGHPFQLLTARARLRPVSEDLRIDWVLVRDGAAIGVEVQDVRTVLTERDRDLGDGTQGGLSDHPGVLAQLRLRRSPGAHQAGLDPRLAWERAASAAKPVARQALDDSQSSATCCRLVALVLLVVTGVLVWQRTKQQRRRLRLALLAGGVLAGLLAIGLLYLGVRFEPLQQARLEWALERLGE